MAKIISFCNQKGGVGKSTTTTNLGAYLAVFGKKVLLVDLDPQGNATSGLGFNPREMGETAYQVIMSGTFGQSVIKQTGVAGMDLLPANHDLAGATVELVHLEDRDTRLKSALDNQRANYDYILIDCPPSLGILTINALIASDEVMIPVQCEYYALEGLGQLLETLNLLKEHWGVNLKIKGALLTMFDKRNRLSREIVKEMRRNFPGYVFDTVIPRNVALAEAPSFSKTILQHDPQGYGAKAYQQLAGEVLRQDMNS